MNATTLLPLEERFSSALTYSNGSTPIRDSIRALVLTGHLRIMYYTNQGNGEVAAKLVRDLESLRGVMADKEGMRNAVNALYNSTDSKRTSSLDHFGICHGIECSAIAGELAEYATYARNWALEMQNEILLRKSREASPTKIYDGVELESLRIAREARMIKQAPYVGLVLRIAQAYSLREFKSDSSRIIARRIVKDQRVEIKKAGAELLGTVYDAIASYGNAVSKESLKALSKRRLCENLSDLLKDLTSE